jgi:hypothetical protein
VLADLGFGKNNFPEFLASTFVGATLVAQGE